MRRRRESKQARAACLLYLRQGAGRSLAKVADELGYKSNSRVEDWSSRYQWAERLLRWTKDPSGFEETFTRNGGWPPRVTGRRGRPDSPQAWEAWLVYLNQGEARSYTAVAEALGKSRSLIARWGTQHGWQNRIQDTEPAAQPDPVPRYTPLPDDELFGSLELGAKDLLASMRRRYPRPRRRYLSRAALYRLTWDAIEPVLRPYLPESPSGLPVVRISPKALEEVTDAAEISLAKTVREAVRFIAPIVTLSEAPEPLWREEVVENLQALDELAKPSRTPLAGTDDHAACSLLFLLANVGRQFERGSLQQPEALEDMLRLLPPFFAALDPQHPAHLHSRPYLKDLARLIALLPGTAAALQEDGRMSCAEHAPAAPSADCE